MVLFFVDEYIIFVYNNDRNEVKRMFFKKKKRKVIGIEGMHCDKCASNIERTLEDLSDIENAKVDLKKKIATVFYDENVDDLLIQKTIEELGYTVTGIKEIH